MTYRLVLGLFLLGLSACTIVVHVQGDALVNSTYTQTLNAHSLEHTHLPLVTKPSVPSPAPKPKAVPSASQASKTCAFFTLPELVATPAPPSEALKSMAAVEHLKLDQIVIGYVSALRTALQSNTQSVTKAYLQYLDSCKGRQPYASK